MPTKEQYTRIFLRELGEEITEERVKECYYKWWRNTRTKTAGGLRLTVQGFRVLCSVDIKLYEIKFPENMPVSPELVVLVDRFIASPYYLTEDSIVLTDSKTAVALTLYDGDLRRYCFVKAGKKLNDKKS